MIRKTGCRLSSEQEGIQVTSKLCWAFFLMACLLSALGAIAIFQTIALWDDEGFLLFALDSYWGGTPVNLLTFPYGPGYIWLHALLQLPFGAPSHESIRWVGLFLWVTSSIAMGLVVYRANKSLGMALAGTIAVFLAQGTISRESISANSTAFWITCMALATWLLPKRPKYHLVGFLAGCVATVKINSGALLILAVGLVLLATAPRVRPYGILLRIGQGLALLIPIVVMRRDLTLEPFTVFLLFILCLTLQAFLFFPELQVTERASPWPFAQGVLGTLVLGTFLFLAEGGTPAELFYQVVGQHLQRGTNFVLPPPITYSTLIPFLAGLGLMRLKIPSDGTKSGAALLLVSAPLFLVPLAPGWMDGGLGTFSLLGLYVLGLAWAGCLASSERNRTIPLALLTSGVLQLSGAYPVAGVQLESALALILASCFCLPMPSETVPRRFFPPAPDIRAGLPPLLLTALLCLVGYRLQETLQRSHTRVPSVMPLSRRIIHNEEIWYHREWVYWNLKENATAVLTVPGQFSFPRLAQVRSLNGQICSSFPFQLDHDPSILLQSLDLVVRTPRAMTVFSPWISAFWCRRTPYPPELQRFLEAQAVVAWDMVYQLLVRPEDLDSFRLVGLWLRPDLDRAGFFAVGWKLPGSMRPSRIWLERFSPDGAIPLDAELHDGYALVPRSEREQARFLVLKASDEKGQLLCRFILCDVSPEYMKRQSALTSR